MRVHVRIPPSGFRQRNEFEAHLRMKLGNAFYLGSERGYGVGMSSLVIYAYDLGAVLEAVQRFGVEVNLQRIALRE